MKKHVLLAMTLLIVLFAHTAEAKKKRARIHLTRISRKENSAAITVKSSREFIVGSNIYVLYIGSRHFDQSEEDISNPAKHKMTFYVPLSEYKKLKRNSRMFLTYGYVYEDKIDEEQMRAVCKANHVRCWSLGRFRQRTL